MHKKNLVFTKFFRKATFRDSIPANPNNIGIGRSMGGIVLRNLERTQSVSSKRINGLTKSSRMETQSYGVHVWRPCQDPFPPIMQRISSSQSQECDVWVWETRTRNVMVHCPSDGFIPSYSQDIASLPASNRYFINGANHIELLNMSNSSLNGAPNDATRGRFTEIFRDRDDIFFVNPR